MRKELAQFFAVYQTISSHRFHSDYWPGLGLSRLLVGVSAGRDGLRAVPIILSSPRVPHKGKESRTERSSLVLHLTIRSIRRTFSLRFSIHEWTELDLYTKKPSAPNRKSPSTGLWTLRQKKFSSTGSGPNPSLAGSPYFQGSASLAHLWRSDKQTGQCKRSVPLCTVPPT